MAVSLSKLARCLLIWDSDGTNSCSEPESGNRLFFPNMPVSEIYLCKPHSEEAELERTPSSMVT